MTTPNTPANGGQILTEEQIDSAWVAVNNGWGIMSREMIRKFARDIEAATLRAAAPAIPTVDRNAVLEEAAALCFSAAALYDEASREQGIDPETKNVRTILRDELDSIKLAIRALKSTAPASAPQAQDLFDGDDAALCDSIHALLALDQAGALVPHGIGGHARTLLATAALRLADAQPTAQGAVSEEPK